MNKDNTRLKPRKRPKSKHRRVFASVSKVPVEKKETMKAAAIDEFGPPSVLSIHELPVPEPGPNEVLVALYASGVGMWDAEIRQGWWPEGEPKFSARAGN